MEAMYIRNPTTSSCHVGSDDIEVDSKGVVPNAPRLSLEIHSCHILLHGRYFIGCHDCSTFFPTSVTRNVKDQIPLWIISKDQINPRTQVENSPRCRRKSEKIEKRERNIVSAVLARMRFLYQIFEHRLNVHSERVLWLAAATRVTFHPTSKSQTYLERVQVSLIEANWILHRDTSQSVPSCV